MSYNSTRYVFSGKREIVWREIARYLAGRWPLGDRVLDAGCGYGDFIRNVASPQRFAIDQNPEMAKYLPPEVQFNAGSLSSIDRMYPEASMNFVFSSNVLEHLTRDEISAFFAAAFKVLAPG